MRKSKIVDAAAFGRLLKAGVGRTFVGPAIAVEAKANQACFAFPWISCLSGHRASLHRHPLLPWRALSVQLVAQVIGA